MHMCVANLVNRKCNLNILQKNSGTYFRIAAEVDGHKGDPDDTRCVHSEAYKFGFVKVFGHVSRLESVQSAQCYEYEVERQWYNHTLRRSVAHEHGSVQSGEV